MIKIPSLITFVLLSSLVGAVQTEASPFYLSVNAGLSKYKDFCANPATGFTCSDTSGAFVIDGGYQLNDTLGLELGYGGYGSAKTSGLYLGSNLEVSEKVSGFRLSGIANFPITKSWSFIGKLGVSRADLNLVSTVTPGSTIPSYTASSTSLLYGIGGKYKINRYYSLLIQYENLGIIGDAYTGKDNLSILTVGLSYVIGKPRLLAPARKADAEKTPAMLQTSVVQGPMRVIIFLHQPAAQNNQALTAAIAQACECQANFIGLYTNKAPIYEIQLAPDETLSSFKYKLLPGDPDLGMKAIMQGQ